MLPKFCLDDNVRSAFRSPMGSSGLGEMKIAKRTREANCGNFLDHRELGTHGCEVEDLVERQTENLRP